MISRRLSVAFERIRRAYPIVYVSGPRQSGKTTFLKAQLPDFTYVNLENPDDREHVREDIRTFLAQAAPGGVVVDEAQRLPELFSYLQDFVDRSGEMGQIVLSGSQNFLMMKSISQSLSGRVGLLNLFPFTWNELAGHTQAPSNVDEFMYRGCYPAIYDRSISPPDFYPAYVQTYIERDVRNLQNIGDLSTFGRFVELCAGRVGQILNYSSIASDIGVDHKTVKSWISLLEAGYVIFLLRPHHKNFNKRVIKSPKLYFYDTGLATSLLRIRESESLRSFHLRGNLFENYVVAEYVKLLHHEGIQPDAYFFRDSSGNEVDMILDRGTHLVPVEIKSSATITGEFFRGLQTYQELSGATTDKTYLVYSGENSMPRKHGQVLGWRQIAELLP
ncbi:MAG: ATP-binding protein [Spirochaetia bacterium]